MHTDTIYVFTLERLLWRPSRMHGRAVPDRTGRAIYIAHVCTGACSRGMSTSAETCDGMTKNTWTVKKNIKE